MRLPFIPLPFSSALSVFNKGKCWVGRGEPGLKLEHIFLVSPQKQGMFTQLYVQWYFPCSLIDRCYDD